MSVIIHGLDMPKYTTKAEFGIDADGNPLCMVHHENGTEPDIYDVVPLPEGHGKLVDAREVLEKADKAPWFDGDVSELGLLLGSEVTTIVPAEGGEADGNSRRTVCGRAAD